MVMCVIYLVIPVMLNVAFLTLMERKVLGYIQLRKGPNKVSWGGILQPFSDAVKLFVKEGAFPFLSFKAIYFFSPVMALFLSLINWNLMAVKGSSLLFTYSSMYLLVFMSLGVYPVLLSGWASNSKYAFIGATRSVAQTISYEISMALIFFLFLIFSGSFSLVGLFKFQEFMSYFSVCLPAFYFWILCSVAETNRSPFDFAEGESELVSGFNIEYGGAGFALIFLAEYASILFLSGMTGGMVGCASFGSSGSVFLMLMFCFVWIWLRGTLPRYRYDKLMNLAWKSVLPISLVMLIFWVSVK